MKRFVPTRSFVATATLSTAVVLLVGAAFIQNMTATRLDAAQTTTGSIASSTRLVSGNSDYLVKTFVSGSSGNTGKLTFAAWVKRGGLGAAQTLISADATGLGYAAGTAYTLVRFTSGNALQLVSGTYSTNVNKVTAALYRDPSAWMHVVVVIDTAHASAASRARIYVDGLQVTEFTTNSEPVFNGNQALAGKDGPHNIGRWTNASEYFDGYMADVYLVDGQALGPENFGVRDPAGRWLPKTYTGSYGNNGFHLEFGNANRLGVDTSGNSNTFATTSNIATTSQLADSPTNNFAVISPLATRTTTSPTLTSGNLSITSGTSGRGSATSMGVSTGKWYWEYTTSALAGTCGTILGIVASSMPDNTGNYRVWRSADGQVTSSAITSCTSWTAYGTAASAGDVIGVALDLDNGKIFFSRNGTWQNSGDPAAGTNPAFSDVSGPVLWRPFWTISDSSTNTGTFNFGQGGRANLTYYSSAGGYFRYAPPTNFKALSTANLPAPALANPIDFFDAKTYIGTTTSQTIGGFTFSPDLIWLKATSTTADFGVFDAVRGTGNVLIPNKTNAEAASTTAFSGFSGSSFSLGGATTFNNFNPNDPANGGFLAWAWKESSTSGVDIVTYTGDNTANRTISHSLGVAPDFVIVKRRDSTGNWYTWSSQMGSSSVFQLLNTTAASSTSNSPWCVTCAAGNWNSSTFMVTNNGTNNLNASGATYVAYLFANKTGFANFGHYRGNGSAEGPFIPLTFKARWLAVKRGDTTGDWYIYDRKRSANNPMVRAVWPSSTSAEGAATAIDVTADGFKIRGTDAAVNANNGIFTYYAFSELPLAFQPTASFLGTLITKDTNFKRSLYVAIAVAKGSGTFMIDHPLDPQNKLLYHSFVESPDMKNMYDGMTILNSGGEAVIELPSYFLKLNKDYRYLATPVGEPMPDLHLKTEVRKKYWLFGTPILKIAGGAPGGKVSWQVTGIRQDPIAKKNPVIVEVDKDQSDLVKKGEYLHPEAYGVRQ